MTITDRIISQVGSVIHAVHIFSPVPYDWDFKSNRAVFKSSRWRHWSFIAATAAGVAYDGFSLYASYKAWNNEALSEETKIGIYSLSYRYIMLTLMNLAMLQNYHCLHHLINALFDYIRQFEREFNYSPPGKAFMVIIFMYRFNYFMGLSGARTVFTEPDNYRLLTSLADEPTKLSIGVKILFFLIHFELQAIKVAMTFVAITTLLGYMAFGSRIIERFGVTSQADMPEMTYTDIYRKHTELRLVQKLHDQAFSDFSFIAIGYGTWMNILCIYQAVVFSKPNVAILGTIILTVQMSIVKMNGAIFDVSEETMRSWALATAPAWFHKWRRAQVPLRVKMGAAFFFDRGLRLTLLDTIVTNAVSLIIAHEE